MQTGHGLVNGETIRAVAQPIPMRPQRGRRPPERPSKPIRSKPLIRYGRAWINGSEVGGVDPRFAHLNRSYD